MKPVMAYTQRWVHIQTNKLKNQNALLAYHMMGDPDLSDEETKIISMSENATLSTWPKSSKSKGSHNEGS